MPHVHRKWLSVVPVLVSVLSTICLGEDPLTQMGLPSVKHKLIHEIDCSREPHTAAFVEFPQGASKVESILGTRCRVLPNDAGDAKYFADRVGQGKGLKAGSCYLLVVGYPEDRSRTMYVCNWGCETAQGFATGESVGDVLKGKYVPNNPESLPYPLSGKYEAWAQLFYLHDRFPDLKRPRGLGPRPLEPADGFWVIIAQTAPFQDPLGGGSAVSTIQLYEIEAPQGLALKLPFPPAGLPRRHVFSREEMADGAVASGHKPQEQAPKLRGVADIASWHEYKMRIMQFLGTDTYTTDLLEFGHNQGWDSTDGGGNDWVYQSSTPELWAEILRRAAQYDLSVLPYFEYRGSIGGNPALALGPQRRCRRLDGGETYTHISWCEGNNADLTDPATIADAKKVLDVSLLKYKQRSNLLGAWFRHRPTALPISFNDQNLKMFSQELGLASPASRSLLQSDKQLLDKYYQWWFSKRRKFFEALRDHLRNGLGPDALVLYTNDASEPGHPLPRSITGKGKRDAWQWMQVVATRNFETWSQILADHDHYPWVKPYDFQDIVDQDMHVRGLQTLPENWGQWEVAHATPPDDPTTYQDAEGVLLTYPFNRLYTVSSPRPFDAYRTKSGLAVIRHYSLNENEMTVGSDDLLGYFVCDVERAGPYCMLAEARAVAYGDPYYLGSLTGNTYNRGFPRYVRRFHAAFLALPALPSKVLADATTSPGIVVRCTSTDDHGTYLAVVNTGFERQNDVRVKLPVSGRVADAVTGEGIPDRDGAISLTLDPAELRTLRIR